MSEQRELTQEEIDLAPEWATHYEVYGFYLIFFNETHAVIFRKTSDNGYVKSTEKHGHEDGVSESDSLITKPFDINEHEFSDRDVENVTSCSKHVKITLNEEVSCLWMEEKDAIAIVKHFESVRAKNAKT